MDLPMRTEILTRQVHKPYEHQFWSKSALFCQNCQAQSYTQLSIEFIHGINEHFVFFGCDK